jgi:hypothetical protein
MAAPISIVIPHRLGKAEARQRIEQGFGRLQAQMVGSPIANMQQAWAEDVLAFSATAVGQRVSGRLEVRDADVRIEVDLPAFLAGLADAIAGKLRREGRLLLEKK